MKSTFLLTLALAAFGANAQIVQNIPNEEPLKLDGEYSDIVVYTMPEDGSEPKARTKADDNGVVQFDNMCNGDIATLKLNNTITSPYILSFEVGCKIDGTQINYELKNAAGDIAWSAIYRPANNNKSWSTFVPTQLFIEDPLEAGEYTFSIEFLNDAGGTKNTANLRNFVFEARESIVSCSLYTIVDPDDEAGTIVTNPNQNMYLEGAEVTLTATAKTGYKFLNWNINGEDYFENPYVLYITESTDAVAYFEELKMYNDVPGWINIFTRLGSSGKIEQKSCNLDDEPYMDRQSVDLLGDYRNGQSETFELNVVENGNYQMMVPYASKPGDGHEPQLQFFIYDKDEYEDVEKTPEPEWTSTLDCHDAYNDWSKFKTAIIDNVNLTEGRKILKINFIEPVGNKYTVNILKIGFSLDGNFDDTAVDGVIAQPSARKAYNVLGVEVAPDAKGLIIYSDGTKVINK